MAQQQVHFVNRFFYPDHSATSQLLTDLAFHLAARGIAVSVVTGRQRYDDPAAELAPHEVIRGVEIRRVASTKFGRRNLAGRAIDYMTFYASAFVRLLLAARRGDIVVALTDPPLVSVIAAVACRLRGAHLVNWVQDLFPEVATAAGMRGAAILAPFRDWSLRTARTNVVLSDGMARLLTKAGARSVVQHNWPDDGIRPVPHERNAMRTRFAAGDRFCVEYSGNLGRAHDVTTIAAAIRALPDVSFVFIGGGSGMEELRQLCGSAPNVRFEPYQPRESLSESLSAGDVHLVSLAPEFDSLVVPSKMYGIMAAGRPIVLIGRADGDASAIIARAGCGITVTSGDAGGLRDVLLALRDDPQKRARMGEAAIDAVRTTFGRAQAMTHWESLLREAMQ